MTTATDIFPSRYLTGAIWCDPEKYPQWKKLPHSIFDLYNYVPDQWQHTLLEFRFFYEWDGESPCILDFSAGCRFRLLVNGVFAEDGPVEVGGDFGKTGAPDWWFGDSRNVTPWLRHGKNEFRFQVVPVPLVQSDYTLGYGWVWSELHAGDTHVTPDNWQFRISHAYCRCAWRDEEENESEWLNDCVPVRLPLPVCFMDLPPLTNKKITVLPYLFPFGKGENIRRCGNKLLVKPGRPVTFFLKLPRLSAGHVEVRAAGQNSVKMFFECEELYGVRPDQAAEEFFASKPGESSCRTFRIYPCRYIKVNLIPSDFRTNSDCDDAVTLEFCFWERTWELCRKRAIKNLPEPWLKKLDDRCLELLQVCMQRIHLDSPAHHEGLGCTGDYRIGANIAALAFGETRLARADLFRTTLLLRQQKKMFHTSYELCFVLMMQEYLERTGEKRFAESCYDAIRIVFEHFRSMTGPEGLISQAENYLFIDWAVDGNITYHHPPADRGTAAMTALWYGALQAMEKIAWLIDMPHDAEQFHQLAHTVRQAFNHLLWDPGHQAYADGIPGMSRVPVNRWLPPQDGRKICTNIGNIMALACGLPETQHQPEKLLQRVLSGEFPVKPTIYYMDYLFMAAVRYHLPDPEKLKILSRWKPFLKDGIRESWTAGDYSHMWSASPAYWLRKKDFFTKDK